MSHNIEQERMQIHTMSSNQHRGGCERIVNDAPMIGDTMMISSEHNKGILEPEAFQKKVKTLREHRNRIKHVCEFLEKNYNEYLTLGTRKLTAAELQDLSKHWHKNKRDLIYKGFNIKIFSAKAVKSNGKTACFSNIRKYFDAIFHGSKESKQPLPSSFYTEMEIYLMSYKKRVANDEESGDLD